MKKYRLTGISEGTSEACEFYAEDTYHAIKATKEIYGKNDADFIELLELGEIIEVRYD